MKSSAPTYPKLPTRVDMPGGEVRVRLAAKVRVEGKEWWGSWDESTRLISVDSSATPAHQWRTFYHELAHAAFSDAGSDEIVTEQVVEAFCDAVSTARMRERFG